MPITCLTACPSKETCQHLFACLTGHHQSLLVLQVQEVQVELQQRNDLVASLDAQLLESNEMVAQLKQLQAQVSTSHVQKKQHKSKSGPAAVAGWVVKAGVTVGGTLLAGQAVQHYQAQQPRK